MEKPTEGLKRTTANTPTEGMSEYLRRIVEALDAPGNPDPTEEYFVVVVKPRTTPEGGSDAYTWHSHDLTDVARSLSGHLTGMSPVAPYLMAAYTHALSMVEGGEQPQTPNSY